MKHVITSLQHPQVKHWVKLRTDSRYRREEKTLIIEGIKPILELPLKLIKRVIQLPTVNILAEQEIERWVVTEEILKKVSGMSSSEGVFAEVEMPRVKGLQDCKAILALDGISDPGNLGTLLRTALAFGWQGVYLLHNCCDLYNEKVLRSARGAHFKLPIIVGELDDLNKLMHENKMQCLVADVEGAPPEAFDVKDAKRILVLGNEANGPSQEILNIGKKVTLPMSGEMESLNVAIAGSILMYLLR